MDHNEITKITKQSLRIIINKWFGVVHICTKNTIERFQQSHIHPTYHWRFTYRWCSHLPGPELLSRAGALFEGVVQRRATSICLGNLPHQERPRIPRASITSFSLIPQLKARESSQACGIRTIHIFRYTFHLTYRHYLLVHLYIFRVLA